MATGSFWLRTLYYAVFSFQGYSYFGVYSAGTSITISDVGNDAHGCM